MTSVVPCSLSQNPSVISTNGVHFLSGNVPVKDNANHLLFQSLTCLVPSTDVIQLTLTLKMTTTQVVNNNSPITEYVHPDEQTQPTFEMNRGFKPFTVLPIFGHNGGSYYTPTTFKMVQILT